MSPLFDLGAHSSISCSLGKKKNWGSYATNGRRWANEGYAPEMVRAEIIYGGQTNLEKIYIYIFFKKVSLTLNEIQSIKASGRSDSI